MSTADYTKNESCSRVKNGLQSVQLCPSKTCVDIVAVVEPRSNQSIDQRFSRIRRKASTYCLNLSEMEEPGTDSPTDLSGRREILINMDS